jgi:hypothetical protein
MTVKKSVQELLAENDPAWPIVQKWIQSAANAVVVLPPDPDLRGQALEEIRVTVRSSLGAVVYVTGGILADDGWLRVLGSGHPRLRRSLPEWNRGRSISSDGRELGFLLMADDVVGGFYALNGGAFGPETGKIFYFAPDALRWDSMKGMGYSEFLAWALSDKLSLFYESLRWDGSESEVSSLGGEFALSIYPFLWSKEGKDISRCSRKPCPVEQVYELNVVEFPAQLASGRL